MFDSHHYVPILKGKAGEFASLGEISSKCKSGMTPLIELITKDREKRKIEDDCGKLSKSWSDTRPIFIDVYLDINDDARSSVGSMRAYFDKARLISLTIIPVTGLRRHSDYQSLIQDICSKDKKGVCLRVESTDMADEEELKKQLQLFLKAFKMNESEVDLLVDFKEIPLTQVPLFQMMAGTILSYLPNIKKWRTLTLAATTFPISMGDFQSANISIRQRGEWTIWTNIRSLRSYGRIPTFGDYAIANPVITDFDPRIMDMTANIRYTIERDWLVLKGRGVKRFGYPQFRSISRTLVGRPEFSGAGFSAGDNYISNCAAGNVSTGNMTTWRRVGTTHHLTFVVDRISSLPVI